MNRSHFFILLVIVGVLALGTLLISILMPFAEIGLNDSVSSYPGWLQSVAGFLVAFYKPFMPIGNDLAKIVTAKGVTTNIGDYAYVVFLSLALVIASLAIGIVGREDATEKTVIGDKK